MERRPQSVSAFSLADVQSDPEKLLGYVDSLFARLGPIGLDPLTKGQQALLIAYWTQGLVANGGLRFFYERYEEPLKAAWAFRELGLEQAALAVEGSIKVFPPGLVEGDFNKLVEWMNAHRGELKDRWRDFEGVIMDINPAVPFSENNKSEMTVKSRKYILEHIGDFDFKV